MKPPRNITRIDLDHKGDHAWVVTLQRKGAVIRKRFSDGVYGGKREALKAAVEYRDSFLALDKPVDYQIWLRTRLRKNNKSGVPGVGRYEVVDNPNTGNVRTFWLASWIDEHGTNRTRKFSVAVHGEEEAKQLAIEEREYQLSRVCAIKASMVESEPPDDVGIWEEMHSEEACERRRKRMAQSGKSQHTSKSPREMGYKLVGEDTIHSIEATINQQGIVRLLEPVKLKSARRALVTILTEPPAQPRTKR